MLKHTFSNKKYLVNLFNDDNIEFVVLIFDKVGFSIGKRVIMDMSNYADVMKIIR